MVESRSDKSMKVTVIIATLNAESFISNALESVMKQTYTNFEVLIIDGGSTDNTKSIAKKFPKVKIMDQFGKGLFDAWNQGIRLSDSAFIAFLDSDDYWELDTLSKHMNALKSNPDLLGSFGRVKYFLGENDQAPAEFKISLLNDNHLAYMPGCFLGRKSIINEIGFFETKWLVASDILWFAKVKEMSDRVTTIDNVVLNKRVHNKNISYNAAQTNIYDKELLELLHIKLRQRK